MLKTLRNNIHICIETFSNAKFDKGICFSLILTLGTALLAFLIRCYVEANLNDNPITHIFVGLSMGFTLTIFIPFIKKCVSQKWITFLIYGIFIIIWVIFLENEKKTGLTGQTTDIIFNLIGTSLSLIFYTIMSKKMKLN